MFIILWLMDLGAWQSIPSGLPSCQSVIPCTHVLGAGTLLIGFADLITNALENTTTSLCWAIILSMEYLQHVNTL
jgi:hypothetical protein